MMDQGYVVSELDRRLTQLIRLGTIAELDLAKAKVRVKLGENLTGWRPWLTTAGRLKTWNPPVVGEQVVVLSPGGDLEQSVVLPSLYYSKFGAPSQDENVMKMELSASTSLTWNLPKEELKLQLDPEGLFEVDVDGRYFVLEPMGCVISYGAHFLRVEDEGIQLQNDKAKLQITPEFLCMTYNIHTMQLSDNEVSISCDKNKIHMDKEEIKLQVGSMALVLSSTGLTLNGQEVLAA